MTRSDAARLVSAGRLTRRSERIEKALAAGDITVSHVEMMARAVRTREDIFGSHGDVLVDAALAVRPEQFRECASSWRAKADDEVGQIDDPTDASRDELTLSPTLGGLSMRGWFHTAAGVEILNLIDGYDHPDPVRGDRRPRSLAQRRALRHRDGGCVVPDCARPPRWSDAHHVIAHLAGGATDLDNLALVCRRHHHMLEHGWTLTRDEHRSWHFNRPTDPWSSRGPPGRDLAAQSGPVTAVATGTDRSSRVRSGVRRLHPHPW